MKYRNILSICLIFAITLSIAQALNRKKTRHFSSRSRSHAQDNFGDEESTMQGSNEGPGRRIRVPFGESRFKTSRSQQKFTADASPDIGTWPNTDGGSGRDYSEIYDHENWERDQDYKEEMPDMDGYESHESSAPFRPRIPDHAVWNNIPWKQYQQKNNFIPLRDTRMWPNIDLMRNRPIVCHCEINLGGIQVLPSNEIQTGRFSPYRKPHDPQTYHESAFRSPSYSLRTRPSEMNPKKHHYKHANFRRPTSEEIEASLHKRPIRPELTTANPMLLRTATEAPTRGGSQSSAVIENLI